MRAKFYIFIFAVMLSFFIAAPQGARGEEKLDTCWTLIYPFFAEDGVNPDSVMIDTCVSKNFYDTPKYAKQWFQIVLPYHALFIPYAPRDSIILKNWRDIDTNFTELRQGFENIEIKYGNFILKKQVPDYTDSNKLASRAFVIKFDNYSRIDSVVFYLEKMPDITYLQYIARYAHFFGNVEDFKLYNNINHEIFPNPANNYLFLHIINDYSLADYCEIYTIEGKLLKRIDIPIGNEEQTIQIDLHGFCQGIYFLRLNNQIKLFQIIK